MRGVYTHVNTYLHTNKHKKKNHGLTLLEAVIALALFLILLAGVFLVWNYSASSSATMLERQSAFENARVSMDALIMNIQLARRIELRTNSNDVLQRLILNQRDPSGNFRNYVFHFDANAEMLIFAESETPNASNEFASNISEIVIVYADESRMDITITTACPEPIVLQGSADVRYKDVVVN
jgi:type II secretory pathway pseudopilin PulG